MTDRYQYGDDHGYPCEPLTLPLPVQHRLLSLGVAERLLHQHPHVRHRPH